MEAIKEGLISINDFKNKLLDIGYDISLNVNIVNEVISMLTQEFEGIKYRQLADMFNKYNV